MTTPARAIVETMFRAFNDQDLAAAQATVSEDTLWIHHGSQKMPSLRFEGKSGTEQFFHTAFTSIAFDYFRPLTYIEEGDTVVVVGEESFTREGEDKVSNKWVQIYTVQSGLIAKMEEFATSAATADYITIT